MHGSVQLLKLSNCKREVGVCNMQHERLLQVETVMYTITCILLTLVLLWFINLF